MNTASRLLVGFTLGAAALSGSATTPTVRQETLDSLVADHHVIYFGDNQKAVLPDDSIRSLIMHFYIDQFRNYQDPAAPYFLFMSRDANMAMGVGGMVRMRAYFDPGNSMPGRLSSLLTFRSPTRPSTAITSAPPPRAHHCFFA